MGYGHGTLQAGLLGDELRSGKVIIGIAGKKGSGKTTAAQALESIGFERMSFAWTMKMMLRILMRNCGMTEEQIVEAQLDKEAIIPILGVSYRWLCQSLGTDWGREHIHDDVWVIAAGHRVSQTPGNIVFDDVRFENEAALIRDQGGLIIHIIRPGINNEDGHASESGIAVLPGDIRISNESNEDALHSAVIAAIKSSLRCEDAIA